MTAQAASSLVCGHGSLRIALPLEHVLENMRPLRVDAVPGMPPFVLGAAVVRGAPTPVVDAGLLLHGTDRRPTNRWVLLRAGDRRVVLAVESICGIVRLSTASTAPIPPLLGAANASVVASVGALDEDFLVVLRASKMLTDVDFRAFEQGSARA